MNELIAIQKIAQWEKLKQLVLDSVSSPITKRVYNMAVGSKYSCGASIILEQASEAVMRLNNVAALFGFIAIIWKKQFVILALVISFPMIMRAEFGQRSREWTLAEQDQL